MAGDSLITMISLPWILLVMLVSAAIAALAAAGILYLRHRLGLANQADSQQLLDLLPGINCGLCGYPSCQQYAQSLVAGKESNLQLCSPAGVALATKLAALLQLPLPLTEQFSPKMVAVVKCIGGDSQVRKAFNYQGPTDCHAEFLLLDGEKSCRYSCLGKGSCVKVCPTNAISINKQNLAIIDIEACIACELCVKECPTKVIGMISASAPCYVGCNSIEHGKTVRDKCLSGCIGCRICERNHRQLNFVVTDNLASVAGSKPSPPWGDLEVQRAIDDCPTGCIVKHGAKKIEGASSVKSGKIE